MADDDIDYSRYAGTVAFPRNPQDLLSTTQCPACLAVLSSTVCGVCGLDLRHPDAVRLHDASVAAAGKLDERLNIIGRIRYGTAQRTGVGAVAVDTAAQAGAADAVAPARPAVSVPPSPHADAVPDRPGDTGAEAATGQPRAPRRSSVQVTLLIVGVSLLSVAAIFFLVYAFINFGIVWRSVIIGAITVAALVVASLLRRRTLTATAEGIAAFAVVLIYLDAWALRENDLLGAGRADATVYWGVTLIAAAIGFLIWHRMSALRIPNVVGFATFAPGVGVLVAGLTRDLETGTTAFLAFASVAAAGLVHRWAGRPGAPALVERVIVLSTSMVALIVSLLLTLWVGPDYDWAPAVAALVIAAIAVSHVWSLLAGRTPTSVTAIFTRVPAVIGGVAAAAAIGLWATRTDSEPFLLIAPLVAAIAVALGLDILSGRLNPGLPRSAARVAGWGAAAVATLALITPLALAALSAAYASVRTALPAWSIDPTDAVDALPRETQWAVVALAAATVLAAGAWVAARMLRSPVRSTALLWAAAVTLVLAVPELRTQWLVLGGWLLLAGACLAALLIARGRPAVRRRQRAVLVTTLAAAGALGYLAGWATTTTWWIGTLVVIGILVASRALVTRPGAKATLLGTGIGLALLSVGSLADQLNLHTGTGPGIAITDHIVVTSIAAVLVLAVSAIPVPVVSALDRRVAFWVAGAASVISVPLATLLVTTLPVAGRKVLLLPEYATSLAVALALLVAVALWVGLRGNTALRAERIIASIAATPALYLALGAFVRVLGLTGFVATIVPITAALLAAAGSLTVTLLRPTSVPRWSRELGVALVGVPAVISAVRSDGGDGWLVLLFAAVAVLLLAIDRDGLFTSRSPRHHLGWLALALATAGFWWRLSSERVDDLEAYVVPLSLVLTVVALLVGETARRETPPRPARADAFIMLGGLLVSLLPLGVNAATGLLSDALWTFATSAALLLGGSAITAGRRWQGTADAAALAGAIGVIVVAVGRTASLAPADLERDAWLAALFLALVTAAFLQARDHATGGERIRAIASQTLGIVAMTVVLVLEIPALRETAGELRTITLVLLFAALHVMAFLVSRAPLTRPVAVIAIVYAAIAGLAAAVLDVLDPIEFASLPIAVALLVTGSTHLSRVPTARSWAWLAPGTAALLVPSLVATIDDRPLWRLVGLGVVGVAVIVIAVVRRLQAPFVIGVVVVLIHGVATFLPQLRAAYEFFPWWLWLGAGGVLLIVLAARYEQRIRNLRSVAMKFAALR